MVVTGVLRFMGGSESDVCSYKTRLHSDFKHRPQTLRIKMIIGIIPAGKFKWKLLQNLLYKDSKVKKFFHLNFKNKHVKLTRPRIPIRNQSLLLSKEHRPFRQSVDSDESSP